MAVAAPPEPRVRGGAVTRGAGLAIALGALAFAVLLSLAVGTRSIPLRDVVDALLTGNATTQDATIVLELRVPRMLLGLLVGVALGLAGALMQALTRNPLADPGLLGVNAGASCFVVVAIGILGLSATTAYVWFAFLGAAVASVLVFAIGTAGPGGATPVRLALAGTALTAALTAIIYGISLTDRELLQQYNLWSVGALSGRGRSSLEITAPFAVAGVVIALLLARPLNAMAMGEDTARALGASVARTRLFSAISITLLCGASTAAAGPIYFVGLTVPHVARAVCGPDQRWVLAYSAVLGAVLVLLADVLGRIIARPGELQVGIVLAFVGAPVFIALVRRKRIASL